MAGSQAAQHQLRSIQFQVKELTSLMEAEQRRRLQRHAEERVAQEDLLESLSQTKELLKKEKKQLKAELKAALEKATALQAAAKKAAGISNKGAAEHQKDSDIVDLQAKLIDLNNRLLDIDIQIKAVSAELPQCNRAEERELLSTKMVILQDTKRILNAEIESLRSSIFRIETAAKVEADKKDAEESGHAELARVEEQLNRISARMDRLKQQMYFPAAKGFRFSTGGSGVYMAAHDLFLSEVSGRVMLTCERVTRPDGVSAARLCITVQGVSAKDWSEVAIQRKASDTDISHRKAAASAASAGATPTFATAHATEFTDSPRASAGSQLGGSDDGRYQIASGPGPPMPARINTTVAAATPPGTPSVAAVGSSAASTPIHPSTSYGSDGAVAVVAAGTHVPNGSSTGSTMTPQADHHTPRSVAQQSNGSHPEGFDGLGPNHAAATAAPPDVSVEAKHVDSPRDAFLAGCGFQPSSGGGAPPFGPGLVLPTESVDPEGRASEGGMINLTQALGSLQHTAAYVQHHNSGGAEGTHPASPNAAHLRQSPALLQQQQQVQRSPTMSRIQQLQQQLVSTRDSPEVSRQQLQQSGLLQPQLSTGSTGSPMAGASTPYAPLKKGEMMSGFLNSLTKKKDKFKQMIGNEHSGTPEGNSPTSAGSAADFAMHGRLPSGRLSERMGRFREGLGGRMLSMKEGMREGLGGVREGLGGVREKMKDMHLGDRVERMREGFGERVDKMKEGLTSGVQEGRGRLSKLAASMKHRTPGQHPHDALDRLSTGTGGSSGALLEQSSTGSTGLGTATPAQVHNPPSILGLAQRAGTSEQNTMHAGHVHQAQSAAVLASARSSEPADAGLGTLRRASTEMSTGSAEATVPAPSIPPGLSVAFDEFQSAPVRKGLYVQLLGENVQLVGERGTKVPDMNVAEFMLEVEVALTAVLEWTAVEGWQVPDARPLELAILQLDHKMRGNNIPLPRTALKTMLNMLLPSIVKRLLLSALPPEVGHYVVASGEQLQMSGEFRVRGPPLSTYTAPLIVAALPPGPKDPPAALASWQQQAAAAARARGLLGLTEHQAKALCELFTGKYALLEPHRPASLCDLCRLLVAYKQSPLWGPFTSQWNKALQVCFEMYGVPVSDRITFSSLMEGQVAALVRKPVQIALIVDTLKVNVDVDAGLSSLHELFQRLVKDLHARSKRGDEVAVPSEPLNVQLEALQLWHAALATQLRAFKARFRNASCSLVMAADREVFQFGAEHVAYDGPLRLRFPLPLMLDPDHAMVIDVKLPKKKAHFTTVLQEIMSGLRSVANAGSNQQQAEDSSEPPSLRSSASGGVHQNSADALRQLQDILDQATSATQQAQQGLQAAPDEDDLPVPILANPVIGQLSARRLAVSLRLDEERVAELIQDTASSSQQQLQSQPSGDTSLISTLLGCHGDLFSASVDVGWRQDDAPDAEEGAMKPTTMLTVANNEVTRVTASLESLAFMSLVAPAAAVSVLHAVVRGILLRFYAKDSYQVRFWARLFKHLHEYLNRDTLNVMASLTARLEVIRSLPPSKGKVTRSPQREAADGLHGPGSGKLRLVLLGDSRAANASHGGSSSGSSSAPVHLINEINLLTLMDSVKLLTGSKDDAV